jgi:hypothetical protein
VCGLHGAPLRPVGSGGVGQLHVVGHILGRQGYLAVAVETPEGHAAIFARRCDRPAVPVLHPGLSRGQEAVVLPGHHHVADAGQLATGERDTVRQDFAGGDPVLARPAVGAGSARRPSCAAG